MWCRGIVILYSELASGLCEGEIVSRGEIKPRESGYRSLVTSERQPGYEARGEISAGLHYTILQ